MIVVAMGTPNGHKVCEYEIPFTDLIQVLLNNIVFPCNYWNKHPV